MMRAYLESLRRADVAQIKITLILHARLIGLVLVAAAVIGLGFL